MKPCALAAAFVLFLALGSTPLTAAPAPAPADEAALFQPAQPAQCGDPTSLLGQPRPQQAAACTGCDSPPGTCTQPPGGSGGVCDFYCQELVGETGFCSLACNCCMCPYVHVTCGWICVCLGLPTSYPTNECPTNCGVQWYCW